MREFTEIFLCMFAVYGAYRFLSAIKTLLSYKIRTVFALRISKKETLSDIEGRICRASCLCENVPYAESTPVLLFERDADIDSSLYDCGFEIYVKIKEDDGR